MNQTAFTDFVAVGDLLPTTVKWSAGLSLHVPGSLARAIKEAGTEVDETMRGLAAQSSEELRSCAAFTPFSPLSSRLPAHYHNIPGPLRRALAHVVGRLQRRRQSGWAPFSRLANRS